MQVDKKSTLVQEVSYLQTIARRRDGGGHRSEERERLREDMGERGREGCERVGGEELMRERVKREGEEG